MMRVLAAALAALAGVVAFGEASAQPANARVPWEMGESLTYDVRFGAIKVGTGRMRACRSAI